MTELEAAYWKKYIDNVLSEKLDKMTVGEQDALRISEFAERYMTLVTGQQLLPQQIFREFLDIFKGIPQMQEDIEHAQEEVSMMMLNLPEECSIQDIYDMFDMPIKLFRMDSDGYIVVGGAVLRDQNGYLIVPRQEIDGDGIITVYND